MSLLLEAIALLTIFIAGCVAGFLGERVAQQERTVDAALSPRPHERRRPG